MSFLFVCFELLAFFLPFLLPTFSLPLANPPVLDTYSRAFSFMDGISRAETEPRTVVELLPTAVSAKETLLAYAAPTPVASPDSPILFLPQDPSSEGLVITEPGTSAHSSLGSEPVPANNTSDQPPATGAVSTPLMMAYYPGWVADVFPPERIDFSRFDWIDFAFAEPDENFTLGRDGFDILSRLVSVAHQEGKKVKLSVGGWDGSKYFSWAVRNESSRHTFVNDIVDVYSMHNLDGIDIDWEYPGTKGHPQNYVDPSDTANLLEFFKLLRAKLPPTARITAAVQTAPFTGADGQPANDVRAFADVLDWALLMNYDVWGASSNPGPNAPLGNTCRNSSQPTANAEAAVNEWTAAGFPSNKLVLGVPSYGYLSHSSATQLRQRNEDAPPLNVHAVADGGAESGQVQFRELVRQNVLCKDPAGPGVYAGCGGFTREWDACSSTPFVRSDNEKQFITYDDPQSLGLKSAFVKQRGLLGVNLFDVHGDTDKWELVDSLRQGLGLSQLA